MHWLLLVPLFALYYLFNCGLALATARLSVHWRDLNNFLPFLTRLMFYTTGIFFSIEERFGPKPPSAANPNGTEGHPVVVDIANYQPIHEFLSLARACLLEGPAYEIQESYWVYATLWTIAMLAFGVWFFWRAEERYGRVD